MKRKRDTIEYDNLPLSTPIELKSRDDFKDFSEETMNDKKVI